MEQRVGGGGRRFKLECQENEVERFILCFVAMTK